MIEAIVCGLFIALMLCTLVVTPSRRQVMFTGVLLIITCGRPMAAKCSTCAGLFAYLCLRSLS